MDYCSRARRRPTIRGTATLEGWRGSRRLKHLVSKMGTNSTLPPPLPPPHQVPHHPAPSLILISRVSINWDMRLHTQTQESVTKWLKCFTQLLHEVIKTNQRDFDLSEDQSASINKKNFHSNNFLIITVSRNYRNNYSSILSWSKAIGEKSNM